MIFLLLLLAIPCSAQVPSRPFRIVNGRLDCYVPRLGGWMSETGPNKVNKGTPISEDSIPSGYMEGIYSSTTASYRVAVRRAGKQYEVVEVRSGVVIERLEDIGLTVYPGEHGWAERWDRYLVVGKWEYFKVR